MINKEEIIQQLEARGASKKTIDKIKNATEREAVDLAWEQLGWLPRRRPWYVELGHGFVERDSTAEK
jgi:hypothetical protein